MKLKFKNSGIDKKMKKILKKIMIIIGVLILVAGWGLYITSEANLDGFEKTYNMNKCFRQYRQFRSISHLQLHIKFLLIKDESRESSLYEPLNRMGANIKCKDNKEFVKQINAYEELHLLSYIPITSARPGDIIILKPTWKNHIQLQRIGFIESVSKELIKFIEHDGASIIFSKLYINSPEIQDIVELSFPIWTGQNLHNGMRVTRGFTRYHDGVDFVMSNPDREVYSFTDGEVVDVYNGYTEELKNEQKNTAGNYVKIKFWENGEVYYLRYIHLVNVQVKVGDYIVKDTLLSRYGNTGFSFGNHCHLTMYDKDNLAIDPFPVLQHNAAFMLFGKDKEVFYTQLYNSNMYYEKGV